MEIIDLTQTFGSDTPGYPGGPVPQIKQIASIKVDGYTDYQINTAMHVGTHMDGPAHFVVGGKRLSEIPVERFFGRGVLIDVRNQNITAKLLEGVQEGDVVLVLTGWSAKFGQEDYYKDYPVLNEEFANKLVELKVKGIGVDTSSPDDVPYPLHKILLPNEILIIENLTNLEKLLNKQFEVVALPIKFDLDSGLARVVAKII